jgi:hypothetical protein
MKINKFFAFILAIGLMAIGFFAKTWLDGSGQNFAREDSGFYVNQFERMDFDSLSLIVDTAQVILERKDLELSRNLDSVGVLKDSLLVLSGRIVATINSQKDSAIKKNLEGQFRNVNNLITRCRAVIMQGILEELNPTKVELQALLKDMKERTEKLKNLAGTITGVSEIIKTVTNILASPLFASTPPAPAT